MVLWGESFWSDGNRGFDVLSSNVKNGAVAIDEFQRFLSESVQCESTYCKSLSRLQSQLIKTQNVGTFTPIWSLMRDLLDKISAAHVATVNLYQDLLRDVHTYQDLYQKKVKTQIQKDVDINRSTDLMSQLSSALHTVTKAKEQYHSIALDNERAKRTGNSTLNSFALPALQENSTPGLAQSALNSLAARQADRLEKKCRQAQEDYRSTIEKYNAVRNEYHKRFSDACTKFQDFEIDHIEKMLAYSLTYSDILQRNGEHVRLAQSDFTSRLKSLTGNDLLDTFVEQKKTGTEPPAVLQFEDIDQQKSTLPLPHEDSFSSQDEFNTFEQLEPAVPTFQAHFSVPSTPTKHTDNSRALAPNANNNQPQLPPTNAFTSTPMNVNQPPSSMNTSAVRGQEVPNTNEPASNPFDLKIRKPKFPGFFGSGRREKKEKKVEKKSSFTGRSRRPFQLQHSRDETPGSASQSSTFESNDFTGSIDRSEDFSTSIGKSKYSSTDPFGQTTSSFSPDDSHFEYTQTTTSASKISPSSSDSSDDDDDNPMTKINVKINPKAETSIDVVDDEKKIMMAMRLVDLNIGSFAGTTRTTPQVNNLADMSKPTFVEQVNKRPLPPPPLPSRPTSTRQSSVTVESVDHTSMFPPQDEFDKMPTNTLVVTSTALDNLFPSFGSTVTDSKTATSMSSTDDDFEVASSFPYDEPTHKSTLFFVLQAPNLQQSTQELPPLSPLTENMPPIHPNFRNSPIVSNDQGMSPLTIGPADQIPLAIAFQETIHVMMSGNNRENWKSRILGEMLISFPASMLSLLADPTRFANTLQFQLKNLEKIEKMNAKSPPITETESVYSFDMTELSNILRNLHDKTPSSRFFNLNVLNYEVQNSDLSNLPIEISPQWTRTFDTISVHINYRFNPSLFSQSVRINNDTVIFYTIITDGERIKDSSPTAEWSGSEQKLWWKVPYVRNGSGSLSATILTVQTDVTENDNDQVEQPLTTSSTVNAYFIGENALFSSIDIDVDTRGYRVSLLKKKILSGKYQSEPDQSEPLHLFQRPTPSLSSSSSFAD